MNAPLESAIASYADALKAHEFTAGSKNVLASLYALTALMTKQENVRLTEALRVCRHSLESVSKGGFKEVLGETIVLLATLARVSEARNLATVFSSELGGQERFEIGVKIALRAPRPNYAETVLSLEHWHLHDEVMEEATRQAGELGDSRLIRAISPLIRDAVVRRHVVAEALAETSDFDMASGY